MKQKKPSTYIIAEQQQGSAEQVAIVLPHVSITLSSTTTSFRSLKSQAMNMVKTFTTNGKSREAKYLG